MSAGPRQGGCLCGAVRYRFTGKPRELYYCHCRMCRHAGGAPVVAWATVPTAGFEWTAARPEAYRSSKAAQRFFCVRCGSPLAFQADAERDRIDLTIASLDDPSGCAPESHCWVESRLPWFDTSDQLPRHEEGSTV